MALNVFYCSPTVRVSNFGICQKQGPLYGYTLTHRSMGACQAPDPRRGHNSRLIKKKTLLLCCPYKKPTLQPNIYTHNPISDRAIIICPICEYVSQSPFSRTTTTTTTANGTCLRLNTRSSGKWFPLDYIKLTRLLSGFYHTPTSPTSFFATRF